MITDLVFDLYGTLVDIHTEENDLVWEKTAFFFGFYGAQYTPSELKSAFAEELYRREAKAGQSYECFPDIPVEQVMAALFFAKGVEEADALGLQAAQLFRISSLEYIRVYPGVPEALEVLRKDGYRLWLLSNAQRAFTAYELRLLGLEHIFDGIYLSSDYGCRKPDIRFYRALLEDQGLKPECCMMIGNDRFTDIAGAKASGMATLYMHTALTPADQSPADPACGTDRHYEFEGDDWSVLLSQIKSILTS
jgi:putative hydrolase of the HAD superfamily